MECAMDRQQAAKSGYGNGRDVVVSIRMSVEERRHLEEDSGRLGCSASELLRRLAGQAAGLGPVLTASNRHALSDVVSSLRALALRLEALERGVRQRGVALPEDMMAAIAEASEAVQALAGLYAALARDGRARLLGTAV
jgi:hypothetical protein